jgi:hypothetical protein
LIYSYINTSGNWENEKLWVFPISTSVDITIYQYGKNVLYLFYNITQTNIKKEIFRHFRVDIELQYINMALSQSAFRIYKCYIIKAYFETPTGLGLEENPDSRKTRTRTWKKSGLVFEKTRTWLSKTRTRNRKTRIQTKDSVYENGKVFCKGLIIVNMINDGLFISLSLYFLDL